MLTACVDETLKRRGYAFELDDGELTWRESWFVLMTDSHGGAAVIDCARSAPRSPVFYDEPEDFDLAYHDEMAVPSIATVVDWWLAAVQAGMTGFDPARGEWWYDWRAIPSERELTRMI